MQYSLFGAEAARPCLQDLDGLLLAGGDWMRAEHDAVARLSVLVNEQWRAAALASELTARGLSAEVTPAPGQMIAVRTEVTPELAGFAVSWRRGASLRVPADLALSASALRLWAIVGGHRDEAGYLLRSAQRNEDLHRAGGGQLARLGIAGIEVINRPGPGWRISSLKRLRRLGELIGTPPATADLNWPTA